MFERAHHRRIAQILSVMDGQQLRQFHCWFAGGTAIVMRFGEFRESLDIDFMMSDREGYRALRQQVAGPHGVLAMMLPHQAIVEQLREVRVDQYGIRTMLAVDEQAIKFEIVLEGRVQFEQPTKQDVVGGIMTLTLTDLVVRKLLANSDRWADDGVFSRDVIDLAIMQPTKMLLQAALAKAEAAYGKSVREDLVKAIGRLRTREGRLDRCLEQLQVSVPKAVVWKHLRDLVEKSKG